MLKSTKLTFTIPCRASLNFDY